VEAPDDRTVIFRQQTPWAWVFTSSNAGSPIFSSIMPEEILHDDDFLNKDALGSGRWMLDGHDNGANIRLRKFPRWREEGLPYLDGIDFKLITETAAAQAALLAQDIDAVLPGIGGFPTRLDAEAARDQSNGRISISSDLSRSYRTLMLKWEEPFLDDRVRHGINLALNRQEMMDAIDFGDGVMAGPVPPAHQRFVLDEDDPDLKEYFRHDPKEASDLLKVAEFPFDREIELKISTGETSGQIAQLIQQQLREVGIKIKITPQDLLTVWLPQTLGQSNFEMTAFTHLPYEDPDFPLRFYVSSGEGFVNFMSYKDDDVDAAVLAAARELDEERRLELTKEAQRVIIRKWAPMLNLYSPVSFGGSWDYVKGLVTGRGSIVLFNSTAWLDK
jgi:peptide/nickel transport system substrate-binding protein